VLHVTLNLPKPVAYFFKNASIVGQYIESVVTEFMKAAANDTVKLMNGIQILLLLLIAYGSFWVTPVSVDTGKVVDIEVLTEFFCGYTAVHTQKKADH
jgi:hypothetical protein